jgi:hypothetical protein
MTTTVPILVVSCDRYSDLWRPFFTVFRKQWPDCPFPVHLGSNHRVYTAHDVTPLAIGPDIDWTSNVRAMLDRLGTEHVILFLEDFLIEQPVDTARVARLVAEGIRHGAGCLRLAAGLPLAYPPTRPVPGVDGVGVIETGEPYRVSTQVALWRVDTLRRLLVPGLSAWEFESVGTQLSEELTDVFWGVYTPAIAYDQCVEKSRWKPKGIEICRAAGVEVDTSTRGVFTPEQLQAHYHAVRAAFDEYQPKAEAWTSFLARSRRRGVSMMLQYLRRRPLALGGWALLAAGLAGPAATRALQRAQLRIRVHQSKRRHRRLARSG